MYEVFAVMLGHLAALSAVPMSFGNALTGRVDTLACQLSPPGLPRQCTVLLFALPASPPCGKIILPLPVLVRQAYDLL